MHLLFQTPNPQIVWYTDPITVSTVVIAVATVINVIGTLLLWLVTKQSVQVMRHAFEASHRPYVTVARSEMWVDEGDDDDPDDSERLVLVIGFKNVGTVPAHDVKTDLQIVVNGILVPMLEREDEPFTVLFPGSKGYINHSTREPKEIEQYVNADVLSLIIKCTYKGATGETYSYEEKSIYDKEDGEFGMAKVIAT